MKALLFVGSMAFLVATGCEQPDPSLQADSLLQAELGLTERDQVHRVTLAGGDIEHADPMAVSIEQGAIVEFVTTDWLIHEVMFERDSIAPAAWSFLERTDQVASPPLIDLDSRYVLSFDGAPAGRYPYLLEGNGASGRGVIIVSQPELP